MISDRISDVIPPQKKKNEYCYLHSNVLYNYKHLKCVVFHETNDVYK